MATEPIKGTELETPIESHAGTAEADHAEGGLAGVIGTFGIRGDLFAAQLINFLLVLAVLWKFAYKPILKLLDEREKKIADSVKNAETIEKRLGEALTEKDAILAQARKDAQVMITKALSDTELRKTEMVEAAKKEVERVIEKGKEQLATEQAAMLIEARKEMVEIAVKAAAKIVSEKLDEKKSKSLAEEVVRKLT